MPRARFGPVDGRSGRSSGAADAQPCRRTSRAAKRTSWTRRHSPPRSPDPTSSCTPRESSARPRQKPSTSVNVDGTRTVVAAANAAGARLVHLSSLAASGPGTVARPVREDDAPSPVNAYGRSKLAGERIVRETAAVPWIILRPSAVYGPGDAAFLPLVRLARRGLFLLATPEATPFSFIYVDDVADAVVRAAESAATKETLFLGHPHAETAASLLSGIAACLGKRYRPMLIPPFIVRIAGWAGRSGVGDRTSPGDRLLTRGRIQGPGLCLRCDPRATAARLQRGGRAPDRACTDG